MPRFAPVMKSEPILNPPPDILKLGLTGVILASGRIKKKSSGGDEAEAPKAPRPRRRKRRGGWGLALDILYEIMHFGAPFTEGYK